ncbi:2-oxoglutarate (2OG) and Fe(II)-dependent oxygenase superfamily protein isoform X2 [Wolffia australiana]
MEEDEGEELLQHNQRLLQSIFGDSDDDDAPADATIWQPIEGIDGLWLCNEFLTADLQSDLLVAIEKGWFRDETQNQAMRFGDLPNWAHVLANRIRETAALSGRPYPIPDHILGRDPLFDQLIVNSYAPGEGICNHVDLMRFEDGIAIVSLGSPCVMHFSTVDRSAAPPRRVPLMLSAGSLVFMSGEARYNWAHGIDRRPGFQIWHGLEIHQTRRISITLRKLCISTQ